MNTFTIKALHLQAGNELYINGKKLDSAETARMMQCNDTGFQWGTEGPEADLSAAAICFYYLGDFYGDIELIELSKRFKSDFVKNWAADQDMDVQIDMHAHYRDYINHFWDSALSERYDY